MRYLLAGVLAALAIGAPSALAGTHVFANGSMGAGGTWTNPPGSNAFMNFDRMSIDQTATVHVQFITTGGAVNHDSWGVTFVQTGFFGGSSRARCHNPNGGTVTGYCAWYD